MKTIITFALAAAVALAAPIKVGTSPNYAPFEYKENDELKGFDIELLGELARIAGVEISFEQIAFDGLLMALQTGKIDMIASGMSATEQRGKVCDFSEPYYFGKTLFLRKKGGDIAEISGLKGRKIGVKIGTIQELRAAELGANVRRFDDSAVIMLALENNKIEGIIFDSFVAKKFLPKYPAIEAFAEETNGTDGFAYVFKKGANADLRKKLNAALAEFKASGGYDKLLKKYGL